MSWIYGFQCGEFIKIGVAQSIHSRLRTLQLYNPYPVKVVLRRQAPEPYWIERRMHALLADAAIGREWFRITPETAKDTYGAALEDWRAYDDDRSAMMRENEAKCDPEKERLRVERLLQKSVYGEITNA